MNGHFKGKGQNRGPSGRGSNRHGQHRKGGGGNGQGRPQPKIPDKLTSPYNFVPVSETVWVPDKDTKVNPGCQDIPFRDGLSGTIGLEITNESPLFIRGSDKDDPSFYCLPDGRYALPASSVKGMVRSVFEIITFSRMSAMDQKRRYSVRDLHNPDLYGEWMTTQDQPHRAKPMAGWLRRSKDGWEISPCDYVRVDISDIQSLVPGNKSQWLTKQKKSPERYTEWKKTRKLSFNEANTPSNGFKSSSGRMLDYRRVDKESLKLGWNNQQKNGWLVFTGQPQNFRPPNPGKTAGKHREFIFTGGGGEWYPVDEQLFEDFELNHSNPNGKGFNDEWSFWNQKSRKWDEKLDGPGIPVFYLAYVPGADPDPSSEPVPLDEGGKLHSFGLSLMYRLAYRLRLGGALPEAHRIPDEKDENQWLPDAAECVFGYAHGKNSSAKGRIRFSPCPAIGKPDLLEEKTEVLSSPRPTYYPNYLEQPDQKGGHLGSKNYKTLMDADARLRGWKRYPVREDGDHTVHNPPPNDNRDICTRFQPIKQGAVFEGRITFHNLRPWELGALLWALTFGEPGNTNYRHSLGMAKPLGYGSVQVKSSLAIDGDIKAGEGATEWTAPSLITEFEKAISGCLGGMSLSETDQVKALLAMADQSFQPSDPDSLLYPTAVFQKINNGQFADRAVQTFAKMKGRDLKLALRPFLEMVGRKIRSREEVAQEKQAREELAKDYPNELTFKNRVLEKLSPAQVNMLEGEIANLGKEENREWRGKLTEALKGKKMRDIRKKLKAADWFPDDWLPNP